MSKLLKIDFGTSIDLAVDMALSHAKRSDSYVEFKFNNITIKVNRKTKKELVLRDYQNAFVMGWGTLGETYLKHYPRALIKEIRLAKLTKDLMHIENQINNLKTEFIGIQKKIYRLRK